MIDITYEIELYINSQNQKIWDEIKNEYSFKLIHDPTEASWKVKVENRAVTIVTPNRKIEYHSFTHELLHVYLDFLGLSKINELINGIKGDHSLKILTKNNLYGEIYNFSSHKKMFPYYKGTGFSEYQFVNGRISFNNLDFFLIRLFFLFKRTRPKAIDQFIGHSISMMNNVVEEDKPKCSKFLNKLKKLKPDLYRIIQDFDDNWTKANNLNLTTYFLNFEKDLNVWLKNN